MEHTDSPTAEEMLKAILEAQGRPEYALEIRGDPEDPHVLEILLDKAALIAAYGEWNPQSMAGQLRTQKWDAVAHAILRGWLEEGAEGAIEVAYSFLPSNHE